MRNLLSIQISIIEYSDDYFVLILTFCYPLVLEKHWNYIPQTLTKRFDYLIFLEYQVWTCNTVLLFIFLTSLTFFTKEILDASFVKFVISKQLIVPGVWFFLFFNLWNFTSCSTKSSWGLARIVHYNVLVTWISLKNKSYHNIFGTWGLSYTAIISIKSVLIFRKKFRERKSFDLKQ